VSDSTQIDGYIPGDDPRTPSIYFLLNRRYPILPLNPKPGGSFVLGKPTPPVDPEARKAFYDELKALDDDELEERCRVARLEDAEAKVRASEREEAARPYNGVAAVPDYAHWTRMAYWSQEEAVALTLGRNPSAVVKKYVMSLVGRSPFADRYAKLSELVRRAVIAKQLFDPTYIGPYLAWAQRNAIEIDAKLLEAVQGRDIQVADWKACFDTLSATHELVKERLEVSKQQTGRSIEQFRELSAATEKRARVHAEIVADLQARLSETLRSKGPPKGLGAKERASLLKLVAGMAVGGYGYKPGGKRSDVVPEIVADLERAGAALDADTVRKYLREACELLPPADH